jgi:hypothetical protein
VDVSGCRLLTDHAFFPLLDALDDNLMKISLETLNVSGLDLLSASMIHQLLNKINSLQELCLGVTYDLDKADRILQALNVSDDQIQFYIDIEKFYTISRLPHNKSPPFDREQYLISIQQEDITALPSSSTWNIPPL